MRGYICAAIRRYQLRNGRVKVAPIGPQPAPALNVRASAVFRNLRRNARINAYLFPACVLTRFAHQITRLANLLIHQLGQRPHFRPMPTGPGIARRRRLTLWASRPGRLAPRFPSLDCFSLPLPLFRCPSACRHENPLIVGFAGFRNLPRAWALQCRC